MPESSGALQLTNGVVSEASGVAPPASGVVPVDVAFLSPLFPFRQFFKLRFHLEIRGVLFKSMLF